jgi:DinB superfamily
MIQPTINLIKQHLIETTENINTWFDQPEALRNYRPSSNGWTINEVLEHIALTSHFLLKLIDKGGEKAIKKAAETDLETALEAYRFEDAKLTEVGLHQSFAWERPEHMIPTGQVSLDEVKTTINEQTQRCLVWLERLKNGEGILAKTTMTVNGLGKIDVYQYIYFLSQHAQRHITQMQKNEAAYKQREKLGM